MRIETYDDLLDARNELEGAEDQYLRRAGWRHECMGHPGALWLWVKKINGLEYRVPKSVALSMQRHVEEARDE